MRLGLVAFGQDRFDFCDEKIDSDGVSAVVRDDDIGVAFTGFNEEVMFYLLQDLLENPTFSGWITSSNDSSGFYSSVSLPDFFLQRNSRSTPHNTIFPEYTASLLTFQLPQIIVLFWWDRDLYYGLKIYLRAGFTIIMIFTTF